MTNWLIEDAIRSAKRDEERARNHPLWFLIAETIRVASLTALIFIGLDAAAVDLMPVTPSRRLWAVFVFGVLFALMGLAKIRFLHPRSH